MGGFDGFVNLDDPENAGLHATDKVLFEEDLECTHLTTMANGNDSRHVCTRDGVFQKGAGNPRSDMPKMMNWMDA